MNFPVEEEALNRAREVAARGKALHAEWDSQFAAWEKENPERGALFARLSARSLPDGLGGRPAGVPRRPQGHRHAAHVRQDPHRPRAGAA